MDLLSADTPITFVPQPRILAYYFVFAAFGWMLHRQDRLIEEFGRGSGFRSSWRSPRSCRSACSWRGRARRSRSDRRGAGRRALYLGALFGWSLVSLFLGAFVKWGAQPRAWVSYLSDASYWCYLVHLPVVSRSRSWWPSSPWPGCSSTRSS
jgi:hypothetical protein